MNNYPNGPQQPYQPQGPYTQYPPQQPGYPPQGQYTPPPSGYPQQPPVQPPKKKSRKGLIIAGILIGAVVLCGVIATASNSNTGTKVDTTASSNAVSSSDSGHKDNTSSQQAPPSTQHFKPGDTVKVGDIWQIVVSNIRSVPAGQFNTLKAGNIYLGVDVVFKNISNKEASLYGNADWRLKDIEGQKYDNAYVSDFPNAPDGKIEPGDPAKGSLIFEIPASVHDLRLSFENNMWLSGQTIWDLTVSS